MTPVVIALVVLGAVVAGGFVAWRVRFANSSAVDGSGTVHLSRAAERVRQPVILDPMTDARPSLPGASAPDPAADPTPEGDRP